ncbi:MAG: GntR family transcriptional regulator [Rubrivivax sp.]|nr:GntR family transcriptional regulator [Rubrivivax sp.]
MARRRPAAAAAATAAAAAIASASRAPAAAGGVASAAFDAASAVHGETRLRLAPRALYQEVAERLREAIFARQLEPGSWIDEQKLAADYGISRTPLREALKVLAVEGLVTMKVRRGAYVTEMSQGDVRQVYHLLGLLEADAAATVARQAGAEQRAELEALHALLESQARSRDAFFATNERFHMTLLRIAGNRWAEQIVTDLRKVMKLNRHHSLFKQGRLADSLAEHRLLMRAIAAGDAPAAGHLMRAHFDNGLEAATQVPPVPPPRAAAAARRGL